MLKRILSKVSDQRKIFLQSDDVIMAAFPKSGSTAIQTLLYIYCELLLDRDVIPSKHLISSRTPDLHISRSRSGYMDQKFGFNFFKTHHNFRNEFTNIIYLIREPRAVMRSYVQFLEKDFTMSVEDINRFISSNSLEKKWIKHVCSFLQNDAHATVTCISHSDLIKNKKQTIKCICSVSGIRYDDSIAKQTSEIFTKEFVSRVENIYIESHPVKHFKSINQRHKVEIEDIKMPEVDRFLKRTPNIAKLIYDN